MSASFSKAGAELLFDFISRAYEHHSLMLTTNLAFEEWTEVFGTERLTGSLLYRLTHRCHILKARLRPQPHSALPLQTV